MARTRAQALEAFQVDRDLQEAGDRLGEAMPRTGWLSNYLQAVTPLTDTPVEFSLASGLCAIAAALGNSLWFETWGQRVYPHVWAVLVAPSSFWRKSTAINMAERVLREADETRVLPSDFSREKLLEELQARPIGLLTLKEFGGFLATIGRDYMAGTKEMLTELYDGPDRYTRSLKAQTWIVERPAISLLAATTLDWLESRITDGDLRGGFLGRFLFITATTKSSPKGLTGAMDPGRRLWLRDGLIDLTRVQPGPVRLLPPARDRYEAWMDGWESEVTGSHHSTDLTGFAVRLQTYALKVAMLHQASVALTDEGPVDEIALPAMDAAIAYCRLLWRNVSALVDEEIAIGREAKELRRLRGMVGQGIARSELLRLSKMKARDFDQLLDTLVQSGEVTRRRVRASEVGLARERDKELEWVEPRQGFAYGSRNGSASVPDYGSLTVPGTEGEPLESGTGNSSGNSTGPVPSTRTPLQFTSLSSLSSHADSQGEIYARGNGTVAPDEDVPWPGDAVAPVDDLDFGA